MVFIISRMIFALCKVLKQNLELGLFKWSYQMAIVVESSLESCPATQQSPAVADGVCCSYGIVCPVVMAVA